MSPVVRTGLVFGLATVGVLIGTSLLGLVNGLFGCLSFISVIALGLGAGYTAAKVSNASRDQRVGRGATAGAIAGGIVLVLGTILLVGLSSLPFYQQATQAQMNQVLNDAIQQNPELRDAQGDLSQIFASPMMTGFSVIGNLCSGLINLVLLVITGLLGSLFWKGAPMAAGYVPAGAAQYNVPPSGSYVPTQTYGSQGYGNQPTNPSYDAQAGQGNSEGGARVYDPNDPNRPQ